MSFGQLIAAASFVLSMGTIALTYYVAYLQGTADICNPFLDGCTDITHTGMKGDGGFIFRGGMISACVLFIVWWQIMTLWLRDGSNRIALYSMQFFGTIAAIGLLVGTVVLLPEKDATRWGVHVRGANLFFQGMLIAMTINYVLIFRRRREGLNVPSFWAKSVIMASLWAQFILFAGVTIGIEMDQGKRLIEWWATAFIGIYYLTSYWDWQKVRISVN